MSFLYPHILWFLFLPALLAGLVLLARRKTGTGWRQLVSAEHAGELVARRPAWRSILPAALCILALASAVAGLARPINGFKEAGGLSTGRNLLIALDISRSMETEDVKPSRLEEARAAAFELIDALKADKIGLIVFSGDADLVVPLTYDHTALRDALEQVNRSWAGTGGTNFGLVLKRAMQDFKRSAPDGTNALVLLSDGEDTVGSSMDVAEEARKNNLLVITVGVGTAAGGPIPDPKGENGLWQDENGKHVISKLDADALRKFSEATGGDFAVLDSNTDLTAFTQKAVRKIDKHEENVSTNKVPNDLFPWFAWAALALLVAAIVIATEWRLPKRGGAAAVVLLLLLTPAAQAAPDAASVLSYTYGLSQVGKDNAAAKEAFSAALLDDDPQMQAAAFYQIGNAGSYATIDKLRQLYGEGEQAQGEQASTDPDEDEAAPSAQQGPKQPSIEELEKIVEELKQDIPPYESALKIDPKLDAATKNIEKIKQLIKDLEEEIERLKQQQQQQNQDQQQNQQNQDQQQQQDQQNQNQQDKQDKQQDQKQDKRQNQDQQNKDRQQDRQQQDSKQQQDQNQQQQQEQQQQQQQEKQDQDSRDKQQQQARQDEQDERRAQPMSEEEKAQQSAADVLRMHLDEEKGSPIPHAPSDTVRKPRKDY
ncbi:MAG: VWA domain-containing protein [Akkermansia sp.]|nr:VWA domain-containing protein [Akkermansia sp.]